MFVLQCILPESKQNLCTALAAFCGHIVLRPLQVVRAVWTRSAAELVKTPPTNMRPSSAVRLRAELFVSVAKFKEFSKRKAKFTTADCDDHIMFLVVASRLLECILGCMCVLKLSSRTNGSCRAAGRKSFIDPHLQCILYHHSAYSRQAASLWWSLEVRRKEVSTIKLNPCQSKRLYDLGRWL